MNETDENVLGRIENDMVNNICDMVRSYNRSVQDYLAEIVAELCEVSVEDMMNKEDRLHCNHARWLFWYAYRNMTNDTFEHIATVTEKYGRRYTLQGINSAVNKMSSLITDNTVWTKRWIVIKRIIRTRDTNLEFDFGQNQDIPSDRIFISIPRELKGKVEIKYKD